MKSARRLLISFLKIAAVVVTTFLLVEFVLLAFNDTFFHDSFYVFDPDMGFRVRP